MSTPMASPAGSGGAGEVQVDLESLEAYVRDVLVPLEERAVKVGADFGATPISTQLFGPVPRAAELADRHRRAYQLYAPTVRALSYDVAMLTEKLRKVIQNYRDQDDKVGEGLLKLARDLSGDSGYSSDRTFEATRADLGGAARVAPPPTTAFVPPVMDGGAGGAPAVPPPAPAPAPAAPTPAPGSGSRESSPSEATDGQNF